MGNNPLTHQAGFIYEDGDGNEVVHPIPAKLMFRDGDYGDVEYVARAIGMNQQNIVTEIFDGGAPEASGMIRYNGDVGGLNALLREGSRGRVLRYRPNLSIADEYPLVVMDYGDAVRVPMDSGRFAYNEWMAPLRVRRIDGGELASLVTGWLVFLRGAGPVEGMTFTRATVGNRINSERAVEEIEAGLRRVTWIDDGTRLRPTGLLEHARTQAFDFSSDLSNAAWQKTRATVAASSVPGPRGSTTNVWDLTETTEDGQHHLGQTLPALTDDTPQTYTFWVRSALRQWVYFQTRDKASTTRRSWIDLHTGELGVTHADHAVLIRRGRVQSGRAWYRISCTFNANNGGTTPDARLMTSTANGNLHSAVGDDSAPAIRIWNPQLEVDQGYPLSDIVSTSATDVTRDAEQLVRSFPFPPQVMSGYYACFELGRTPWPSISGGSARLFEVGDAASLNPRLILLKPQGDTAYRLQHQSVFSDLDLSPSPYDYIELFPVLFPDGHVQLFGRKNDGAIQSGSVSGALELETAWSDALIHIASLGAAGTGDVALDALGLRRDVLTPAQILARVPFLSV